MPEADHLLTFSSKETLKQLNYIMWRDKHTKFLVMVLTDMQIYIVGVGTVEKLIFIQNIIKRWNTIHRNEWTNQFGRLALDNDMYRKTN